jgi:hypothetical protein
MSLSVSDYTQPLRHFAETPQTAIAQQEPLVMELPNDIWDIIVKQSTMSITEIVKDMDDKEIRYLEYIIWKQKRVNKDKVRLEKALLKKQMKEKAKLLH